MRVDGSVTTRRAWILPIILLFCAHDVVGQAYQTSIADAWLKEAAPNENHGDEKELPVKRKNGDSFRAIYKFDLSSYTPNANVVDAEVWLRVSGEGDQPDPVHIHSMSADWLENSATWNNTASDFDPATVWASFVPNEEGWEKVDVTDLIQAWVCGDIENFGLMLIATSDDEETKYTSREWDVGNRRPRLYVTTSGTAVCGNSSVDHFRLAHDNHGINCLDETITVYIEDAAGQPVADYEEEMTLDSQNGNGNWALISGGGTFVDTIAGDGRATYVWPGGESEATFALSYDAGPETLNIDVFQTSDSLLRDDDSEGDITFSPSGFSLTSAPLANPPAAVTPFSASQAAGAEFPVYLTAYGQTPTDPACGVIESYDGAKNLKFWSDYVNPSAGGIAMSVDALGIPAAEVTATNQLVTFVNGQAAITAKYKDVGRVRINVKDDGQAHPDLPNGIRGATAAFVVKPFTFALSGIEDSSGNPNPAAVDGDGDVFVAAGESFSVTVTALDAEGSATPNYGREAVPEGVRLTSSLVLPAGGDNPPVGNGSGFGVFAGGQASGANFSWAEVGIITLTPSVADGDYLGAGDVAGTTSGRVGRFRAHHFTSVLNVPTLSTGCAAGAYTYIGQPFGYSNAPQVTFTARALAGEIAENYSGAFFKVDNATVGVPVYTAVPATLDTSGLPPAGADPAVTDLGGGSGSLVFSGGSGLRFTRSGETAPFDADIRLSVLLTDGDGTADAANPLTFGDPGGIVFDGGPEMRFGRARFQNAYGSELVGLALPLRTEYFVDATTGFVAHSGDACTQDIAISLASFEGNLDAGETCVHDSGAPGLSGAGCPAAGPQALRFRSPPLGGDFNLHLAAPGAGNDGSTTATADVPAWLEYDWNAAIPGNEDPVGTAVFGIYEGQDRRIYLRELY